MVCDVPLKGSRVWRKIETLFISQSSKDLLKFQLHPCELQTDLPMLGFEDLERISQENIFQPSLPYPVIFPKRCLQPIANIDPDIATERFLLVAGLLSLTMYLTISIHTNVSLPSCH